MLTSKLFFSSIVPLVSANLFLFVLVYLIISRSRFGKEYSYYITFLATYTFYLIGPIIQEFRFPFDIKYYFVTRVILLFSIGFPSLLIALILHSKKRINRNFIIILFTYGFIWAIAFIGLRFDYYEVSFIRRPHVHLQTFNLLIVTILPCLYFIIKTSTSHSFFLYVFASLFLSCFMLGGAMTRDYAIYYSSSILSAFLWGYAIFSDLHKLNSQLKQHQQSQIEWAASQFSKLNHKEVENIKTSIPEKLDTHYPFKEREDLISSLKNSNGESEEICDNYLIELKTYINDDLDLFRSKCKETLFLIFDQMTLIQGGTDIGLHELEKKGIELDQATSIESITLIFKQEALKFNNITEQKLDNSSYQVKNAQTFILKNYHLDIGVREIASAVHLSQSHLMKLFKEQMDITINQYLNEIRINKSKPLLKTQSVTKTALDVGFKNSNYFATVFKKHMGITPKQFQENEIKA